MSHPSHSHGHRRRPLLAPLAARSPDQVHRAATPLELFYDLVIVVAVAQAAAGLHHALGHAHFGSGVLTFSMVFFGIWWSWVNFTWFASAYDNDDVCYRLLVLVQMTGALVFAAGIPRFAEGDLRVGVLGYVIMRLGLVTLWLRAARSDPERRLAARRFAAGVFTMQLAWVAQLFLLEPSPVVFWLLAAGELLVPVWAERSARTPWHAEHIVERYGLFTLITLGESILAASFAVRESIAAGTSFGTLISTLVGGLLIVFAFWWLYFEYPGHDRLGSMRGAFLFGYGHYFVFAAAAAVGAGLSVAVDHATHRAHLSDAAAAATVAIPAALYLASLWVLHAPADRTARVVTPIALVAILLSPLTGQGVLVTGLMMAGLTAYKIARGAERATAVDPS